MLRRFERSLLCWKNVRRCFASLPSTGKHAVSQRNTKSRTSSFQYQVIAEVYNKCYFVSTRWFGSFKNPTHNLPTVQDVFQPGNAIDIPFTKLTNDYVSTFELPNGQSMLKVLYRNKCTHRAHPISMLHNCRCCGCHRQVDAEGLRLLASTSMREIAHKLRSSHLGQLSKILDDAEASENDRCPNWEW